MSTPPPSPCRSISLGGKQEVGGEVGNSSDGSGKEYNGIENNEQYSIESRVGDLRSQNKQRHKEIEMATYRKKHAEQEIASYS